MKLTSLALFASFAVAGYVQAQTAPQESAPAPAESKPEKSHHHPLSSACREEVSKLCGPAHGKEMMGCIKDNLDTNKFSANCQSELKEHAKQPAKPAS
jgi:hypothetical protein